MRIKFAHPMAVAAMFLCGVSSFSHSETLGEIYAQALENDHQFKAAQAAYQAGLENKSLGRASLLPQISGEATWSKTDGTQTGLIQGSENVDRDSETTSSGYSLTLAQPLFNMESWFTFQQGKLGAKIAEMNYYSEQQNLIVRTAEAYFDALRAAENLSTAKAEENALSHQLEQTQKRFEVGLTAITEVHEAQAAFDSAVANRLIFEGQLGISFEALEVLTGQPYTSLSPLKNTFPVAQPTPLKRQEWVDFAIENNFQLAISKLNAKSFEARSKQFKSRHLPTLTGSLSYSNEATESDSTNNDTGVTSTTNDYDQEGTSVVLRLNVPIFTGGSTSAGRRQAAYEYVQAQEQYYKAQRDTIQSARSLHLTVVTSVATVKARKQAITSNKSALEATQAGYEVGTRDLVDVLNAQRNLYAAQRDYLDSLYTYVINTLNLKQAAGLLSEKDIAELDAWLNPAEQIRSTY